MTKNIYDSLFEMKQQNFEIFLDALLNATSEIQERYFRLPVTYRNYIFRERAYCYELYHQLKQLLQDDFPYVLSGEINKAGHPLISTYCGQIIPDFLVHNPGYMGPDDNLVILEVKTIQRANFNNEGKDLLKDMNTIGCMTSIKNGYYKGIILIFGSNYGEKKSEIVKVYKKKNNIDNVLLLYHDNPMQRARIL